MGGSRSEQSCTLPIVSGRRCGQPSTRISLIADRLSRTPFRRSAIGDTRYASFVRPYAARNRSGKERAVKARFFSSLFWLFMVVSSILLFPIAVTIWLLTVLFDKRLVVLHRFTCFWASLYSWLNPVWRVRIEGREKIRPGIAYVMVANHQSL